MGWLNHYEEITKEGLIEMLDQYHTYKGELPPIKLDKIEDNNMYFVIDYDKEQEKFLFFYEKRLTF